MNDLVIIVFEDDETWIAQYIEQNIVAEGATAQEAVYNLINRLDISQTHDFYVDSEILH